MFIVILCADRPSGNQASSSPNTGQSLAPSAEIASLVPTSEVMPVTQGPSTVPTNEALTPSATMPSNRPTNFPTVNPSTRSPISLGALLAPIVFSSSTKHLS